MKILSSKKIIITGLVFMFLPFILITFVGWPLSLIGNCIVVESQPNSCIILGYDFGEFLYTIGILGWSFLFTFPVGGLMILIGLLKKYFEN